MKLAWTLEHEDSDLLLPLGVRLLMTVLPVLGFGAILATASVVGGPAAFKWVTNAIAGSFVGLGKFVILPGGLPRAPVSVWSLAALVVYGDLATMFVMMANVYFLYKVPFLGRRLAQAHEASWRVLHANPWMRRRAWLGIVVFVAAPFQGTGAVIGTVLARLLGLSRFSTATAITLGSSLGCLVVAMLGAFLGRRAAQLAHHPYLVGAGVALVVVLLVMAGRRFVGASIKRDTASPHGLERDRDIA